MTPRWVFFVRCHECSEMIEHRVEADFLTTNVYSLAATVSFWVKPKWYSRRRMVAAFDWNFVVSV